MVCFSAVFRNTCVSVGLGLVFLTLHPTVALSRISSPPLDGTFVPVKETKVAAPYSTTTNYVYAAGEVFDRWVYNPWVTTSFTADQQAITNPDKPVKRAMLTADLTIASDKLVAGKSYAFAFKSDFSCLSAVATPKNSVCDLTASLSCYGYVDKTWTRTYLVEKTLSASKDGQFAADSLDIPVAKCTNSLHFSMRGVLAVEGKTFGMKLLQIAIKDVSSVATAKPPTK